MGRSIWITIKIVSQLNSILNLLPKVKCLLLAVTGTLNGMNLRSTVRYVLRGQA